MVVICLSQRFLAIRGLLAWGAAPHPICNGEAVEGNCYCVNGNRDVGAELEIIRLSLAYAGRFLSSSLHGCSGAKMGTDRANPDVVPGVIAGLHHDPSRLHVLDIYVPGYVSDELVYAP